MTEHCHHSMIFQDMLQDQLVFGLKNEHMQQCPLSEGDTLTLEKRINIAQAMKSAIKQSLLIPSIQEVKEHLENIHKVQNKGNLNCYLCEGKHVF